MHVTDSIRFPKSIASGLAQGTLKGQHIRALNPENVSVHNDKQYIASQKLHDLHIIEIRGTFENDWCLDILPADCFWLHFQYMGQSHWDISTKATLSHQEYQGFRSHGQPLQLQLKKGKTALMLVGLIVKDMEGFDEEWPLLAHKRDSQPDNYPRVNIGYRIQQLIDKIQQCSPKPYSLNSTMAYLLCESISQYHNDVQDKMRTLHKDEIFIYREAVEYISNHYMKEDINSYTIAAYLNVSERKLYRAFEDKHTTIHSAIQTIRLYKARELLRETDTPVDGIAFQLHFSTAHYFYKQYVQRFGHSPSKERQLHRDLKKKKKKPK